LDIGIKSAKTSRSWVTQRGKNWFILPGTPCARDPKRALQELRARWPKV